MYNHKQKSNVPLRKNHKTADRKGGGGGANPCGQPDRKISVFFTDDFPYHLTFHSPHNHDSELASKLKFSGFRGLAIQRRPALPKLLPTNEVFIIVVVFVIVFVVVVFIIVSIVVVIIVVVAVHEYHLAAIQSQNEFLAKWYPKTTTMTMTTTMTLTMITTQPQPQPQPQSQPQ